MSNYVRCEGSESFNKSHYIEIDLTAGHDRLCPACRKVMQEADAKQVRSWDLFAEDKGDHFEHFYPSTMQVRMCGNGAIMLVRLTPDGKGPYWGWYYSHHPINGSSRGQVAMIYRIRQAVEICFPYGPQAETRRGRGEILRLRVDGVRPAKHPEGV